MPRSTDRILTTHAGSLPRPDDLIALNREQPGSAATTARLRTAVAEVVAQQASLGVDIVNDGEYGKPTTDAIDYGAWAMYVYERLSGYERRPLEMKDALKEIMGDSQDRRSFPGFYAQLAGTRRANRDRPIELAVNVGPVRYTGHALIERDIANFKAALGARPGADAFMSAIVTGVQIGISEHYRSKEDEAVAVAEAMREEYRAITSAGFNVQLDDPLLVNVYEFQYSVSRDVKAFRNWAARHVELVNHALDGIPEEQVRYHLCWGSWEGPHSSDLPLHEVIDLLLRVKASQYSFEAGNPQHEHEWQDWEKVRLPPGRALIPGVVTHKTTVLEHPETVAQRLMRYALIVGKENVIAGTDCGLGGRIHPELAWAKLRALTEGAARASERLW
jgi:5-methyltetrahydropteroyltriglutamate--homocysteine methyltransferase